MLRELRRLLFDLVTLLAERSCDAFQDISPARHPSPPLWREVGAAEERATVGSTEDVERPAAVAVDHLLGIHVDLVDIGSFLAVDLDADDELVLQRGDLIVLEGFTLHHVTPVAGGVAHADQDRFVFRPSASPGFIAPWIPIHGIVGVLQEVGRSLPCKSIWHRPTLTARTLRPIWSLLAFRSSCSGRFGRWL